MLDRLLHPFEFFAASYLATALVAVGCAYLGVFVALKRIVFIGVAIAEISAAGIATALVLVSVYAPHLSATRVDVAALAGAVVFSLVGVAALAVPFAEKRVSREGIVAVCYAAGAAGAILVVWRSANDLEHVKNILAGSSLFVSDAQLATLAAAFAGIGLVHAALRKEFVFCAFDPQTASTLGLPARKIELLLYVTIGLAIALALRTIGVLPVFGFLSIPALEGLLLARRFRPAFLHAVAQALIASAAGLLVADFADLPPGPATVAILVALLVPAAVAARVEWFRKVWLAVEAAGAVVALALVVVSVHAYVDQPHRFAASAPHLDQEPVDRPAIESVHASDPSHSATIGHAIEDIGNGEPHGIEQLILELSSDAPPFERGEALDALKAISKNDFGYDPDRDATANAGAIAAWRDWFAHVKGRLVYDRKARTFR